MNSTYELNAMISTGLLIDHGEHAPTLARMMEAAWPDWYRPGGASAMDDLIERQRQIGLPLGVVAFRNGEVAGTCALTVTSGGLVTPLTPWLGGLIVDPAHRRKGVAAALLQRAAEEAGRLGYGRLFALTAEAGTLFEREGWERVEEIDLGGAGHTIFARAPEYVESGG